MVVKFLAPAQAELREAIAHYQAQEPGLGSQLAEEVERTLERILQYPEAWSQISERTRRCRTNKFPYGIIYQVQGDVVFVVAVMHLRRKPRTWKDILRGTQE